MNTRFLSLSLPLTLVTLLACPSDDGDPAADDDAASTDDAADIPSAIVVVVQAVGDDGDGRIEGIARGDL